MEQRLRLLLALGILALSILNKPQTVTGSQEILSHLALTSPNSHAVYINLGSYRPGNAVLRNFASIDLKQAAQNVALFCLQTEQFAHYFKDFGVIEEKTFSKLGNADNKDERLKEIKFIEKHKGQKYVTDKILKLRPALIGNAINKTIAVAGTEVDYSGVLKETVKHITAQLWSTTSAKFEATCNQYRERFQNFLKIVRNSYAVRTANRKSEQLNRGAQTNHLLTALRKYEEHLKEIPLSLRQLDNNYKQEHPTHFTDEQTKAGTELPPASDGSRNEAQIIPAGKLHAHQKITGAHFRHSLDYNEEDLYSSIQRNSKVNFAMPWEVSPCEFHPDVQTCEGYRKKRSVDKLKNWLDNNFRICPKPSHKVQHKRKKRFALLALGAFIASTMALATSFSTKLHDEKVLQYLVDQNEVKRELMDKIVLNQELMSNNTILLANKIDKQHTALLETIRSFKIESYQTSFNQAEMQLLITQMDLNSMITKYEQSYQYFRAQRVPIPLVSVDQLTAAYRIAQEKARENGQALYAIQPDALLTYKCLLVWLIGQPYMVLEIPMYDKLSQEFDLMHLTDQSVIRGNYSYQIDIPKRNVLVNKDRTLFRELSNAEVKMCEQMELSYVNCPSLPPIFYKDTINNCHIALLTGHFREEVMKICRIKMHPKDHDIIRRQQDKYDLFSQTPAVATKRCVDGEGVENINFGPGNTPTISLGPGCSLETAQLKTFNSRDIIMAQSITLKEVDLKIDSALAELGYRSAESFQRLNDKIKLVSAQEKIKSVPFDDIHQLLKEDRRQFEDFHHSQFFLHPYMPIIFAVAIMLGIAVIYCCLIRGPLKERKEMQGQLNENYSIIKDKTIRLAQQEKNNESFMALVGRKVSEIVANPHAPATKRNEEARKMISPTGQERNPRAMGNTKQSAELAQQVQEEAQNEADDLNRIYWSK